MIDNGDVVDTLRFLYSEEHRCRASTIKIPRASAITISHAENEETGDNAVAGGKNAAVFLVMPHEQLKGGVRIHECAACYEANHCIYQPWSIDS